MRHLVGLISESDLEPDWELRKGRLGADAEVGDFWRPQSVGFEPR
jgi:hypothetical protein